MLKYLMCFTICLTIHASSPKNIPVPPNTPEPVKKVKKLKKYPQIFTFVKKKKDSEKE